MQFQNRSVVIVFSRYSVIQRVNAKWHNGAKPAKIIQADNSRCCHTHVLHTLLVLHALWISLQLVLPVTAAALLHFLNNQCLTHTEGFTR